MSGELTQNSNKQFVVSIEGCCGEGAIGIVSFGEQWKLRVGVDVVDVEDEEGF